MKKFLFVLFAICLASFSFTFFILFEGRPNNFSNWWQEWTRDSEVLPFGAYKTRRINSSDLVLHMANKVEFQDNHLFWKGGGARALPELTVSGEVVRFIIVESGSGYSDSVRATIKGAQARKFVLGQPIVKDGAIVSLPIIRSSRWNELSLAFCGDEPEPFTGTAETILPSGQIIDEVPYFLGKLHGKALKYNSLGIPVSSKEYNYGKKNGTHIFWFQDPRDPDDYKPEKSKSGELLPSLWSKIRETAKEKFGEGIGSGKANKWIVDNYRLKGGDFQVKLLEHWRENRRHGLFEGFDHLGNKTFKDEYTDGLRTKHKTFDKTKG